MHKGLIRNQIILLASVTKRGNFSFCPEPAMQVRKGREGCRDSAWALAATGGKVLPQREEPEPPEALSTATKEPSGSLGI